MHGRFDHLWDAPAAGATMSAAAVGATATATAVVDAPAAVDPPVAAFATVAPPASEPGSEPTRAPLTTGNVTVLPPIIDDEGDDIVSDATVRLHRRPGAARSADIPVPTPASAPVSRSAPVPAFEVELSTGERVPLDAPVVIGRAPQATPGVRLVPTPGHLVDLSRSHLAVEATPDGVQVRDLGSGNGSVLLRDGKRFELAPYAPTMMIDGDTIVLADVLGVRIGRRS